MTMAGHPHGMKSGGVQTSVCVPVRPGGTADTSPPIYRWDHDALCVPVPEGRSIFAQGLIHVSYFHHRERRVRRGQHEPSLRFSACSAV